MPCLAHDLLLLVLNLSRIRSRARMIDLFVEALGWARPGVAVRRLGPGEESSGEVVEVATSSASFGRIAVEGALTPEDGALFRNAILILAVLLENASREERLASENARLDQAVAAGTAELRAALAELSALYEEAPCGYHSLAPDATVLRMNETELRWLGYRRGELLGRSYRALLAPRSLAAFDGALRLLAAGGAVLDVELELVRKDGSLLPVLLGATAERGPAGELVESRMTVVDLTERRRVEEQLRQAQKLEAIGRLAGGIAHDFNNHLTVILGAAGTLLEGLAGQPLREEVAEIELAASRAAALTRQLLAFSRRQRVEPRVLELGELVTQLDRMLRRLISEHVELVTVRHPGLRRIRADPGQLEQVIVNLAVNARDAMPEGGRLTLEIRNAPADEAQRLGLPVRDHVLLSVRDTGCGMEPSVAAHLFEPFFTTKAEGKGTGLGLSTVYGVVKQCGGEVRVDTAPGKGTAFHVYLPAVEEGVEGAEPGSVEQVSRGSERVLLVEDEPAVRRLALRALREAGYDVLDAADGEEALRLAGAEARIDVLVTDMVMPRVGGAELAERIRERRPGMKVLFVSGYGEGAGPPHDAPGHGFAFLSKPFTPAALSRGIRELLDAPARPAGRTPEQR